MNTIACPSCGNQFELSEALTGQIRDHLKSELQAEVTRREAEAKSRLLEVEAREQELTKQREVLDEQVQVKVKDGLKEAEGKAKLSLEAEYAGQLKELEEAVRQRDGVLKDLREQELALRKQKRDLEQAKENMEIEVARKLDDERAKVRQEVEEKTSERHRLKDLEREKIISDLRSSLEDMKRKAEQGSMETQGEVLELDFEAQLKRFFLQDEIRPVPKGIRGADLVQVVKTRLGSDCGTLLWETKNTRAWSGQWIAKLKTDMTEIRANLAILVSVVLPEGVSRFGMVEGIWVSDPASAIPLAAALREHLLAVHCEREASIGKSEKMELLYQYLAGSQFKQKIEGIVDAFTGMKDQLSREQRAMEKLWKEREKQIERVIKNTVGLYGDMQGIIGGSIPSIPALELEALGPSLTIESPRIEVDKTVPARDLPDHLESLSTATE